MNPRLGIAVGICVAVASIALGLGAGTAEAKSNDDPLLAEDFAYPPYHGPKKTVAVSKFDATGGFLARYGGWDIGGGLAAMLIGELQQTNRFIVVERADLNTILKEQELGLSGLAGRRAPASGQLLGAQTLVRGSVTEFDEGNKGSSFSIGLSGNNQSLGAGRRKMKGHITIDLRMSDTTTGRIIDMQTVSKTITSKSSALELGTGGIVVGGDRYNNTSLGRATRAAIREAVLHIIETMEDVPWQGLVASVNGNDVYINAGRNAGLQLGQSLSCFHVENEIKDPATGEVLGIEETQIGTLELSTIEERYAVGRFSGSRIPAIGDLVRMTVSN